MEPESQKKYSPPSYPPPKQPLLKPCSVLCYPIDLEELAWKGWTTLAISDQGYDPLYKPYSELFDASASFFSLPEETRRKYQVPPRGEFQVSEEGYSRVEGEKCMITLRKADNTPKEFDLLEKAEFAWRASGKLMYDVLSAIEESLGMKHGTLIRTTEAQLSLPKEGERNVATLMRLFRYDRPPPRPSETDMITPADHVVSSRTVAEPHKDLGLLTIVVGHTPGLECWDPLKNAWVSCETKEGLNASILVGQTLATFTNGRFAAGRHRVFVHPATASSATLSQSENTPSSPLISSSYRYSIVHALRGHLPLYVSHEDFETSVTGNYPIMTCFRSVPISEIYRSISNAHYNINISIEDRRRQERMMRELAEPKEKDYGPFDLLNSDGGILESSCKDSTVTWLSKLRCKLHWISKEHPSVH